MGTKSTIFIIIVFILLGLLVVAKVMQIKSENICEGMCEQYDALGSDIVLSGNWKVDDLCICYKEDSIKTIRMGK